MRWEIAAGGTLRDLQNGQTMHSSIGAWEEAQGVYVAQSALDELATRNAGQPAIPLVVYDIGMGVAANPIAFLEAWKARGNPRPVRIISFESEPDALKLALRASDSFPYLRPWIPVLEKLLESNHVASSGWSWELRTGDFRGAELGPAPELIYFDFYAPKVCGELWTEPVFRQLRENCAPDNPCRLITYSAATRVRLAMLEAGWFVGTGNETSIKAETTVASTSAEGLSLLGLPWLERRPEFRDRLSRHPQFNLLRE